MYFIDVSTTLVRGTTPSIRFWCTRRRVDSCKVWVQARFNWPHGLLVMPDASLWALDAGAVAGVNGQVAIGSQALHLDKNGQVLAMLGKPGVSAAGRDTLNKPSDIAIGRNGDIFIADGHSGGAARLVKFNSRGEYVTECGSRGAGPGQMGQPHALAMDSRGRIFLADRTNNRINIYDQDCRFLTEWKQFGRPSWVAIDSSDTIYVVDTQTTEGRAGFENGIYIGDARDGKVTGFIPQNPGSFGLGSEGRWRCREHF